MSFFIIHHISFRILSKNYSSIFIQILFLKKHTTAIRKRAKLKLCGFVGNFDKKGINFNDPLCERISYYGVVNLHRYTPRCLHSSR